MGVLYTIGSTTGEVAEWLNESGFTVSSDESSRLPLLGEICGALNSLEDSSIEYTDGGIGSPWQAMVTSSDDPERGAWTLLNITKLRPPSEPQELWFEKGFPELIVSILSKIANSSGTLIVVPDTGCAPLVVPPNSIPEELCAQWEHINPSD